MRIAIDARYLKADFSGIGVYSENLLEALAVEDSENEYIVVVHSSYRGELALGDNFEVITDRALPVSVRTVATLHSKLLRYDPEVLHSFYPLVPMLWRRKLLTTIHDLQPLYDRQFTGGRPAPKRWLYDSFYRIFYPAAIRRADFLISDSFATKEYLLDMFPTASDKILVVHGAPGRECFRHVSEEEVDRVREKYSLPKRYMLYLGSTRPNKNLQMMLDAFEEFLRRCPEQDDLYWVVVVKTDRFFDPFFARIREKNMLRRVQIHEQISEQEKVVFYNQAELLYFVTKFEGFGLPVLEAQAQGVPVVTSSHAALPEVAGSGALICDPDDLDSIVDALERFYQERGVRERLVDAGQHNVQRFSWKKAAGEIVDMYNHLLA